MNKNIVYLLCGLTGSGKTTYAKKLEAEGVVRLSLDEEIFRQYGRYGVDYVESEHLRLEEQIRKELDEKLARLIKGGESVVLDYGLWGKEKRDYYKKLVSDNQAEWKLIYFKIEKEELIKRLKERNVRTDPNALPVTKEMLTGFFERFEEPKDEDEEIIEI